MVFILKSPLACGWMVMKVFAWELHAMKTLSILLALCKGNTSVTEGFLSQRLVNAELWCLLSCWISYLPNNWVADELSEIPWCSCDVTVILWADDNGRSLSSFQIWSLMCVMMFGCPQARRRATTPPTTMTSAGLGSRRSLDGARSLEVGTNKRDFTIITTRLFILNHTNLVSHKIGKIQSDLYHMWNIVECRYNTVKYNMILHTSLWWLRQNAKESLNLQKTP